LLLTISGCVFPKTKVEPKTFTAPGLEVTLTNEFQEQETDSAQILFLKSNKYVFITNREPRNRVSQHGITNLKAYIKNVLINNQIWGEIQEGKTSNDTKYYYAYYESYVNDLDMGYQLLVFEGVYYFYTVNIGCRYNHLESSKELFFSWANSIKITELTPKE
jgi:hypothetical protein